MRIVCVAEPDSSIRLQFDHTLWHLCATRPRGGENTLATGVKQTVPYRTGREAWYLPVSTE